MHKVDMIASALGLERVGHIFTSTDQECLMTPEQIRKSADLQNQYSFNHALGYRVPKYVTVVARKKGEEDVVEFECYMISDQGQALERDNCFGHTNDKNAMVLREPADNEMMPTIVTTGKPV